MRGPLSIGRIARSLLRATGMIALLAALVGATTLLAGVPTGSARHARGHVTMYQFPKPTVSVDVLYGQLNPSSIDVSGQGFTPGDALHLQLIASDGPYAGSVLAEGGATATPDAYLTQADGQEVPVPGGQFTATLTASSASASDLLCQAMTHAVVTVVGSASSNSIDISRWGCVPPTVTALEIAHYPLFSVDALGSGFTPGGLVRIYLEMSPWYYSYFPKMIVPLQIVASVGTTAATATYVSNSQGTVYTPGGHFDVNLGVNCQVYFGSSLDFAYSLVATDEATGITTSTPLGPSWCG